MPTVDDLEKQRRQEAEPRQQDRDRVSELPHTWMILAIVAASAVLLCDILRDHVNKPARMATDHSNSPASLTPEGPQEERSFDFDDPSPITKRMAHRHLIRYDGYAPILDNNAHAIPNRFTKELVLSLGEMRRYEVMLDLHDLRIDGTVPDELPRDVVEAVMHDLRK